MIKITLDNQMLYAILDIEKHRDTLNQIEIPLNLSNKLRKNTRKRSSYASNAIEGNPLTYEQAEEAIDSHRRHYLKPEQEIRNYYAALGKLESHLERKDPFSLDMILEIQETICSGEPVEKIGLRGPMPAGVLFAVWNEDRTPSYIPPEYSEIRGLLDELVAYVNTSDDHPLVKAAVVHYQLVTIHPFEDGNGRTARIMSGYVLSYYEYGFKNIGSLEEYISYDVDEYYESLQMGLPVLYYDGRDNPPHPEIWMKYFLKVFGLYAAKVLSIAASSTKDNKEERLSHLSKQAKIFLEYIRRKKIRRIYPSEIAKQMDVTNRTIINWCVELSENGFLKPNIVKKRVLHYDVI